VPFCAAARATTTVVLSRRSVLPAMRPIAESGLAELDSRGQFVERSGTHLTLRSGMSSRERWPWEMGYWVRQSWLLQE